MNHSFIKKWGTFIAACVLYFAVCIFLYVIQYRIYGDVVKTPLIYVTVLPAVFLAAWLIQGGYPKPEEPEDETLLQESGIYVEVPQNTKKHWHRPFEGFARRWQEDMTTGQKANFIFSVLILTAATIFMFYALITNPYMLMIYFYFATLAILGIFSLYEPKGRKKLSVLACVSFCVFFLVTFLYLQIASPMSVDSAARLLESQGYERVTYNKAIESETTLPLIFDHEPEQISENSGMLGYYLFAMEKDGVYMGAAVSVVDKNIVAEEPADNGSGLNFYMTFE